MNWYSLAIISVVLLAIANLFQRALMEDAESSTISYSLVFQLACGALVGVAAGLHGFSLPPMPRLIPNFILTGVLYGTGTLLLLKALQRAEVSEVTVLKSSSGLWTIAVATLFFGESLTALNIVGIVLIFVSVVIVVYGRNALRFGREGLYALGAAFCYGTAFANDAFILRYADALSYTTAAFLLPAIFIFLIRPRVVFELKPLARPATVVKMIFLAVTYSASAILLYLAYQRGGAISRLAPINQSVIVLTVMLGAVFLNERDRLWKKVAAALVAAFGVFLLR